jgi:hypothetical protein
VAVHPWKVWFIKCMMHTGSACGSFVPHKLVVAGDDALHVCVYSLHVECVSTLYIHTHTSRPLVCVPPGFPPGVQRTGAL